MTDEVDPRLVALGLVPATPAASATPDRQTAGPPNPRAGQAPPPPNPADWVVPTAPPVPPAPPPPARSPTPSVSMPAHKPLTVGDLFPGMGKFSGTPSAEAPPAPPPRP